MNICALVLQHLQAEKNLAWEAAQQQAQAQAQLNAMGAQAGSGPCKLLVTNLNVQLAVSLASASVCCLFCMRWSIRIVELAQSTVFIHWILYTILQTLS